MKTGPIKVYVTSVPGSTKLRKQQQQVVDTLECQHIPFECIDISDPCKDEDRKFMRANSKGRKEGATPLPPQIFNNDSYCGDFDKFSNSLENDQLYEFLELENPNKKLTPKVIEVQDGAN